MQQELHTPGKTAAHDTILSRGILFLGGCAIAMGVAFLITYIWSYPNLFFIDFGGHIASAQMFWDHGLHGWSMERFQGLINNLFYPPAQDALVALIHAITQKTLLSSFLLYVSALIILHGVMILLIAKKFTHPWTQASYLFFSLAFLCINKFPNIHFLQGLGIIDMLFTGLHSQILGGLFLQVLLYEFLGKQRIGVMTLTTSAAILSHLIVGPVAMLVFGGRLLFFSSEKYAARIRYSAFAIVLGLTAFFRFPFVIYAAATGGTNLINPIPHSISIVLLGSIFLARKNNKILMLASIGLAMLIPTEVFFFTQHFGWEIHFPRFHYYRFAPIAALFAIISMHLVFDERIKRKKIYYSIGVGGLSIILGWMVLPYTRNFLQEPLARMETNSIPSEASMNIFRSIDPAKKILTIDAHRSIDFAIDSLDQYHGYKNHFAKGLFRESSYTNQLLSSYIATLLGSYHSVLYYAKVPHMNDMLYTHIRDKFVTNYNIGYLFVAPKDTWYYYMDTATQERFSTLITSGTRSFYLENKGTTALQQRIYTLYEVRPRSSGFAHMIERISPVGKDSDIHHISQKESVFTQPIFSLYEESYTKPFVPDIIMSTTDTLLQEEKFLGQITQQISGAHHSGAAIHREKKDTSTYHISVDSPIRVQIKISPLPGWRLQTTSGEDIPLYTLPYGRYALIRDTAILSYRKTIRFFIGYSVSITTILLVFAYGIKKRRKKVKKGCSE